MKRQSKKEKEVIDRFREDTKGMTPSQITKFVLMNDTEKVKFIQKFRDEHGIKNIVHDNRIEDSKSTKSKTKSDKQLSAKADYCSKTKDLKSPKQSASSKQSSKSSTSLTKKEREKGLRTERIWIKGNPKISHECQCSNDLRNAAQYFERTHYFKNRDLIREKKKDGDDFKIDKKDRYIYHNELDKMKDRTDLVIDDNGIEIDTYKKFKDAYRSMSMACLSQQTLVLVVDSWEGYFEGFFGFLNGDPNYTGMPKIPGYGNKGGEYVVTIPNDKFWIISGQDINKSWGGINKKVNTLAFEPGLSYLKLDGLETTLDEKADLREIRIVPAGVGYWIEIVYKLKEDDRKKELLKIKDKDGNEEVIKLDHNIVGGIDLGLRNAVTKGFVDIDPVNKSGKVIGKIIEQPIIFKGGILKSINQYYNKRRAEIQSIYEHQAWKLKRTLRHLNFQNNVKTKNSNSSKEVQAPHL